MRDDIERFRLIYRVLHKRGRTDLSIATEMGVSPPVVTKLAKDPIQNIGIRASILAKLQDFNKKYNYDSYADVDVDERATPEKQETEKAEDPSKAQERQREEFWMLIRKALKIKPGNVTVKIMVN